MELSESIDDIINQRKAALNKAREKLKAGEEEAAIRALDKELVEAKAKLRATEHSLGALQRPSEQPPECRNTDFEASRQQGIRQWERRRSEESAAWDDEMRRRYHAFQDASHARQTALEEGQRRLEEAHERDLVRICPERDPMVKLRLQSRESQAETDGLERRLFDLEERLNQTVEGTCKEIPPPDMDTEVLRDLRNKYDGQKARLGSPQCWSGGSPAS